MKLHDQLMKAKLYKKQQGRCNAPCEDYIQRRGIFLPKRLLELDHIDSNGPDDISNRQLLCSHCNRVKREHPMEYLLDYWERKWLEKMQPTIFSPSGMTKKRQVAQQAVTGRRPEPQYMHNSGQVALWSVIQMI